MTENSAGGDAGSYTPTNTLTLGGETVAIEKPSGRKASITFRILRGLEGVTGKLAKERAKFVREYETENVQELDRAQARLRFPSRPIVNEDGTPARDDAGELVYAPSLVDTISEADWTAAGGKLRLPRSPDTLEELANVLPVALDLAEDQVYKLLALFTLSNSEVKTLRRNGADAVDARLEERIDELLDDADADELLELGVVVIEVITSQFQARLEKMGGRVGNALAAIGLGTRGTTPQTSSQAAQTTESSSSTPSSDSTPTSFTDSPPPMDGDPTTPSTQPTSSSSLSDNDSTETPNASAALDIESQDEEERAVSAA